MYSMIELRAAIMDGGHFLLIFSAIADTSQECESQYGMEKRVLPHGFHLVVGQPRQEA